MLRNYWTIFKENSDMMKDISDYEIYMYMTLPIYRAEYFIWKPELITLTRIWDILWNEYINVLFNKCNGLDLSLHERWKLG